MKSNIIKFPLKKMRTLSAVEKLRDFVRDVNGEVMIVPHHDSRMGSDPHPHANMPGSGVMRLPIWSPH